MSPADVASALGLSENQAKRVLDGTTKSLKLDQALRLCRRLGISPWDLAGEPEPRTESAETTERAASVPALATLAELEELEADFEAHVEQDLRLIALLTDALGALAASPATSDPLRRAVEGLRALGSAGRDGSA
jgi:transcriptional regulator with XRE-family HTH domain